MTNEQLLELAALLKDEAATLRLVLPMFGVNPSEELAIRRRLEDEANLIQCPVCRTWTPVDELVLQGLHPSVCLQCTL